MAVLVVATTAADQNNIGFRFAFGKRDGLL